MEIDRFEKLIEPALAGLDEEIARILGSDHPLLRKMAEPIMAAPGKRLRPKLLVLCARMLGYHDPDAITYAAVFEMIHTATLIHDDIIDDANTRRGLPTMSAKHGKTITILYGDLLYTKAHTRAIEAGRLDVMHTIDWISERMIEGELLQHHHLFDRHIDQDTYFDILKRKTAYLFAGTTKTAAQLAGLPEEKVEALFQYGFELGVAFQLMDDYLDYRGNATQMGKPVLSDLVEGKVTLPLLRLLNEDPTLGGLVDQCWEEKKVPEQLVARIEASDVLEYTLGQAREASEKALRFIESFPDNEYKNVLCTLPLYLLSRNK